MKKLVILSLIMIIAAPGIFAQNNKKQDWAQFYVFQKDNARIMKQAKDAPKGKHPKSEWKNRKIKAVLMGDSITELWWGLDSTFFKDNNFVGRGISGQTTSEMLVRFRRDVLDLRPQYVFIMAGTNDIAENNGKISLENILGNIKSMVELARFHNVRPILCSVPPAAGFVWRKDLTPAKDIIALNKMIQKYAERKHIPYIDFHSELADKDGGFPKKYAKDGVHPTIEGYKVMERLLLERFQEIDK